MKIFYILLLLLVSCDGIDGKLCKDVWVGRKVKCEHPDHELIIIISPDGDTSSLCRCDPIRHAYNPIPAGSAKVLYIKGTQDD